jgi:hypothetical protein
VAEVVNFSGRLFVPNDQVTKAVVSLAIEKSLLHSGEAELKFVARKLYDEYKCYFSDCYKHPEYLRAVLKSTTGSSYHEIIDLIKHDLADLEYKKEIADFVEKLSK